MFQNDPCKVLTDEVRLSYVHMPAPLPPAQRLSLACRC